jgi:ribonuclease Y
MLKAIINDKNLQAKEHFIELKSNHEREVYMRGQKISEIEKRAKQRESQLQKEINFNTELKRKLNKELEFFSTKQKKIASKEKAIEDKLEIQIGKLEELSQLSAEEAKAELMDSLKEKAKSDAMGYVQQQIEEARLTAQQEAKKIVINTIQRIGTEEGYRQLRFHF